MFTEDKIKVIAGNLSLLDNHDTAVDILRRSGVLEILHELARPNTVGKKTSDERAQEADIKAGMALMLDYIIHFREHWILPVIAAAHKQGLPTPDFGAAAKLIKDKRITEDQLNEHRNSSTE